MNSIPSKQQLPTLFFPLAHAKPLFDFLNYYYNFKKRLNLKPHMIPKVLDKRLWVLIKEEWLTLDRVSTVQDNSGRVSSPDLTGICPLQHSFPTLGPNL